MLFSFHFWSDGVLLLFWVFLIFVSFLCVRYRFHKEIVWALIMIRYKVCDERGANGFFSSVLYFFEFFCNILLIFQECAMCILFQLWWLLLTFDDADCNFFIFTCLHRRTIVCLLVGGLFVFSRLFVAL